MRPMLPVLLALALAGCSVERGSSNIEPQELTADAGVPDVPIDDDAGIVRGMGAGTMTGTWAMVHEASACVLVEEQVTWGHYLIQIEQEGNVLHETRQECDADLSPLLGLQPEIPPEKMQTMVFHEIDTGWVNRPSVGGSYASSTELGLWGMQLEDILNDPLPTEPDDPAVVDGDEDGKPGITITVAGTDCERYIVTRQVIRYQGAFVEPNLIAGGSLTINENEVLDASRQLCAINASLTPNDDDSRFVMVRVDGAGGAFDADENGDGEITCEEAEDVFPRLLERREPDPTLCDD